MHLRLEIERHLRSHPEITPTELSRQIANDPKFVSELRRGRELRPKTERKVVERFESYLKRQGLS